MRVVVADDAMLIREGLTRLLRDAGVTVVGKASDAHELMRHVVLGRPDVAVLTSACRPITPTRASSPPSASAPSTLRWACSALPVRQRALRDAPARGASRSDRLSAQGARVGHRGAHGRAATHRGGRVRHRPDDRRAAREQAAVRQRAQRAQRARARGARVHREGHSNPGIASLLVLSTKTVESHVHQIFVKLDSPRAAAGPPRARGPEVPARLTFRVRPKSIPGALDALVGLAATLGVCTSLPEHHEICRFAPSLRARRERCPARAAGGDRRCRDAPGRNGSIVSCASPARSRTTHCAAGRRTPSGWSARSLTSRAAHPPGVVTRRLARRVRALGRVAERLPEPAVHGQRRRQRTARAGQRLREGHELPLRRCARLVAGRHPDRVRALCPAARQGPRRRHPIGGGLMLIPASGGAPQVLRHFAGDPLPGQPAWSPDGTQLVFPLSTAKQPSKHTPILDALNVLDLASGSMRAITPLALGPANRTGLPTARGSSSTRPRGTASSPTSCIRTGAACARSPTRPATSAPERTTCASSTRARCGRAGRPTVARSRSSATRRRAAAMTSTAAHAAPISSPCS